MGAAVQDLLLEPALLPLELRALRLQVGDLRAEPVHGVPLLGVLRALVLLRSCEFFFEVVHLGALLLGGQRREDPLGVALQPLPVPPEPVGVRLDLLALRRDGRGGILALLLPRLPFAGGGAFLLGKRGLLSLEPVPLALHPGARVVRRSLDLGGGRGRSLRLGHRGIGISLLRRRTRIGESFGTRVGLVPGVDHAAPDPASFPSFVPVIKERLDQRGCPVTGCVVMHRRRRAGDGLDRTTVRIHRVHSNRGRFGSAEVVVLRVVVVRGGVGGFVLAELLVVVKGDGNRGTLHVRRAT